MRNAYKILVGKPDGKRPLERPMQRWEDNIKMVLWKTEFRDVDWVNLAQERDWWKALANMVISPWVP
jgi:hypothetical protein